MPTTVLELLRAALAGRYDLRREVARGGMGAVFEATDLKHRRPVAIKVLDPELASAIGERRFQDEIETAARLTHPHIVPLHDSGEAGGLFYYVMPLIVGESLRQRLTRERQLPVEDAIRITREVADALRYAHDHGLIHRDIKPENILLSEGHALVFDFGIARLTGSGSDTAPDVATQTLAVAGTPTYMSPEQLTGGAIDGRSDQYCLACVLYEALAGQPPFTGSSADNIALQHRTLEPRPITALRPTTPAHVARALARGLAKAPADRFPTIGAFADAVAAAPTPAEIRTPPGAASGRVMLAVLPLENRSPDPEQEFFTDGMTDELITHLGRLQPKKLGVIARTSAMRYKRTEKSIEEIGRELNVEYLLEGSVRRAGDRIRITAQLIQVADQTHLWAESYDRRLADVFDLQTEVASTVAGALAGELLPAKAVSVSARASAETVSADSEAYEAYLKGRFYWNKRTHEALRLALQWFERAAAADPGFARAYSGIADVYYVLPTYGLMDPAEAQKKSSEAVHRALELAPGLIEAQATIAAERGITSPADAMRDLLRVIEHDPSYVPAYIWCGMMLHGLRRFEEAITMLERARRLDPLSVVIEYCFGTVYYMWGKYDHALTHFRKSLELEQAFIPSHCWMALSHVFLGHPERALSGLERLEERLAGSSHLIGARGYVLGVLGRREEARAALRVLEERAKTEYVSWEWFAYCHAGLRDVNALLALLERTPVFGTIPRMHLELDPAFGPARADPRFPAVLAAHTQG